MLKNTFYIAMIQVKILNRWESGEGKCTEEAGNRRLRLNTDTR